MQTVLKELTDRLSASPKNILVVVGSGVSIATSDNDPLASWKGLLEHGIFFCTNQAGKSEEWAKTRRDQLKLGEYIEVASAISSELGGSESGLFADWLQQTIGNLKPSKPELIRALQSWNVSIATTNYDTLISQITGFGFFTWQDKPWLAQFVGGERTEILHLHGVCDRPQSVVLGSASYENILRDETAQGLMKSLVFSKCFVFVGCGAAGLSDPNMGSLIDWYRKVLGQTIRPSYLLAIASEQEHWRQKLSGTQIRVVVFGESHSDLPNFVAEIGTASIEESASGQSLHELTNAQTIFDRQVQAVLSGSESSPGDKVRHLMELVRTHLRVGGRRSAWMAADGQLRLESQSLPAEERTRFGIELASIMLADGMPDNALETLRRFLEDVASGEIGPERRHQFWELQSRCLQALGPYEDTGIALERAISLAPDEETRLKHEAELAEVRYLKGDEVQVQEQPKGAN